MWSFRHAAAGLIALALLASDRGAEPAPRALVAAPGSLAPGDVVFIAVDGAIWSQLASGWSSPARRFGHVGIAARAEDGAIVIVHAGGSPVAGRAPILAEDYSRFAAEADRVGIYRLHAPASVREAAGSAALALRRGGAVFDTGFSLSSTRELYCTELVWRAIRAGANLDAAPRPSTIAGRPAITLRDLETSSSLHEVGFAARRVR
jgi:Permuted papain-like amidase enzyme, YaeF/YiiX, C92 family